METGYPKYHQMGVDTRLAEDQNARREALNQSVIAKQRRSDLTSDQDFKNKQQLFKKRQDEMLKTQADGYSTDVYSELLTLKPEERDPYLLHLKTKYSALAETRPDLFVWEGEDWGKVRVENASKRLGKEVAEPIKTPQQKNYEAAMKDPQYKKYMEDQAIESKITGSMADFVLINGRRPNSMDEFTSFEQAVKTSGNKLDPKLKALKDSYFKTLTRANRAKLGVDQYIPDPNREEVAAAERASANVIAKQFKDAGGDIRDLGIVSIADSPSSPEIEVGDIIQNKLTKERKQWDGKKWITL